MLTARDGRWTTAIQREGDALQLLSQPPLGWVPDALSRVLRRSTPAPDVSLSRCVEGAWLAAVSRVLWPDGWSSRPAQPRWDGLAVLHPLAPNGSAATAEVLAAASRRLDTQSDWNRMRRLFRGGDLAVAEICPPGGRRVPLERWHDDGSFCRWVCARQDDAETLVGEVVAGLDQDVAEELVKALVSLPAEVLKEALLR